MKEIAWFKAVLANSDQDFLLKSGSGTHVVIKPFAVNTGRQCSPLPQTWDCNGEVKMCSNTEIINGFPSAGGGVPEGNEMTPNLL